MEAGKQLFPPILELYIESLDESAERMELEAALVGTLFKESRIALLQAQVTLLLLLLHTHLALLLLEGHQLVLVHGVAEQVVSLLVEPLLLYRNQNEVIFSAHEAISLTLILVLAAEAEVLLLFGVVLHVQAFLMHSQSAFRAVDHHVVARGLAGEAEDTVSFHEVLGGMSDSLEELGGGLLEVAL